MDLIEKWLVSRIAPPESVEADTLSGEVHLCAYQAMGPVGVHRKAVAEDGCLAFGIGTTEEEDTPFGQRLEVEFPVFGKWPPRGSGFDPGGSAARAEGEHAAAEARSGSWPPRTRPEHWFPSIPVATLPRGPPTSPGSCSPVGDGREAGSTSPRDRAAVLPHVVPIVGQPTWTPATVGQLREPIRRLARL